ncbi:hypothetical protein [Pseudomonas fluvialis]|uniref:hypothetical protein n=1 Tax=Pseudomonas fluvialis TaxID=1793966 RepID=UPI0035B4F4A2
MALFSVHRVNHQPLSQYQLVTLGSVSGAILGGLAGSVGGCAIGAQLGESLDRHVLAHNLCLLCGHRFNLPA